MKKTSLVCLFSILLIFAYGTAYSEIVVKTAKGEVAVKKGREWIPLNAGQRLEEGDKISTGINSSAVIDIDGSLLTVKQLTMMKISKNKKSGESVDTNIGLKFGSLNAKVEKLGKLKTSFKITTPVATSSVRGTEEEVSYGAKSGMTIDVIEGTVVGENNNGISNTISGNSSFNLDNNNARPDNLLSNLSDQSLVILTDPNSTPDEQQLDTLLGGEVVNGNDAIGVVNQINPPNQKATVTVNLNWK